MHSPSTNEECNTNDTNIKSKEKEKKNTTERLSFFWEFIAKTFRI